MFKKIVVKHALNHPTIVFLRDLNSCASYTALFLPFFSSYSARSNLTTLYYYIVPFIFSQRGENG